MPNPRSSNPDWWQRLKEEVTRNKKQTVLLTLLLAVGLFVGVRMLKKKPSSASAAPSTVMAMTERGEQGASTGWPMLPGSQGPGDSERDTYIRSISHDITRDLFEFQADLYPVIKPPGPGLDASPETVDGPPGPAIEELVRARSAGLALQSTIDSGTPIAVINGQVLVLGDMIDGFTVVEIGIGLCVVEQAGVQIRLEMDED